MPTASPQTTRDRLEHEGASVHPDTEGGIELLRDNLADNQYFQDIDEFGDADGYPFNLPQNTTGFHFYATDVGKKSLRKQTGVPEPADVPGWDMTDPWLSEGTLPVASPKLAAFGEYRPPAPVVISVAGGKAGYVAGTYELYMTLRRRGSRRWTLPSSPVSFTLTTGQGMTVTLPDDLPRGLEVGLWLTRADKGQATARLQKVVASGKRTTKLYEYRSLERGRRLPTHNETMLATPPKIKVGGRRATRAMVRRGPAPRDLLAAEYRFTWWKVTPFGTTRASTNSDLVRVDGDRVLDPAVSFTATAADDTFTAIGHGFAVGDEVEVRGGSLPAPLTSGSTYFVVTSAADTFQLSATEGGAAIDLTSDGSGNAFKVTVLSVARRQAFIVRPPRKERDVIGWVLGIQINGTPYALYRTNTLAGGASYLGFGHRPIRVYGDVSEEGGTAGKQFALSQQDFPLENTSGMESPSGSPEAPAPFQASTSLAAVGKRRYAYAEVVSDGRGGEKVSLPSPAVEHTTAAGEYARVLVPDPNNIFFNAEGRERGSDGVPLNMSVAGANGSYDWEDGKHTLTTGGNAYASDTIRLALDAQAVNTSQTYCFRGWLEATITAGTAEVILEQLDSAGVVATSTILRSLSANGAMPFEYRIGPNGDVAWNAATVTVQMRVRMIGASRNMTIKAWRLAGHPYLMAPRPVIEGEPYEAANFDPPSETPYPRGVVWAVGPAPVTSVEAAANEPLETLDFTTMGAFPPTGWTAQQNPASSAAVNGLHTLADGTQVYRSEDTSQNVSAYARIRKMYTSAEVPGDSLAIRTEETHTSLPGGTANYVVRERINDTGGTRRGSVEIYSSFGGVWLVARDKNGDDIRQGPFYNLSAGDADDREIIATGAGTVDGTLTLLSGRNGEQRSVVGQISGIDWRTVSLREATGGTYSESNTQTRWTFDIKRIVTTLTGDAIGEAAEPPSGETAPPPDRPDDGAGNYYTEDVDGETINQGYLFVPPGYPRFDIDDVARWAVIPAETYTFGIRARRTIPVEEVAGQPWFLTLHNPETGEVTELGAPFGTDTGVIGWVDGTVSTGVIPDGFTELRAHFKDMGPGLWLFQDIALSQGTLKRGYGCAASGWFRAVLKGKTPYVSPVATPLDGAWREIDAKADIPEGTSITPSYEHSDDLSTWTTFDPSDSSADLPDAVYGAVRVDMTGDGRETPYVPAGSPYLSWKRALPTICREDGTSFSGGTLVGEILPPFARPEYESDRVGGHNIHTDVTEAVNRIREGFRVGFENESDALLFARNCLEENWILEVPQHGGTVAGKRYVIDIDEIVGHPEEAGPDPIFNGYRNVRSVVEVSGCEVLEEGSL